MRSLCVRGELIYIDATHVLQPIQSPAVINFCCRGRQFGGKSLADILFWESGRYAKEIRCFILFFCGLCNRLRIVIVDSYRPEILTDGRLFNFNYLLHIYFKFVVIKKHGLRSP